MSNGFLIHLSNTFLVSHQRPYPIYNSKRPTCHNSIQDHRSGNREDLTTNTKNLPLLLIFNCRCSNRVGKAGNRNKRTGTAPFGKQWINSGTGEKDTQKNEQNRSPAAAVMQQSEKVLRYQNWMARQTRRPLVPSAPSIFWG